VLRFVVFDYYGKYDYADDWIQAALSGGKTDLAEGNADWQGKSLGARARKKIIFFP
jgi:hypothetical protein